ncbi:MAG TPA: endonuclease/exonuclease/phosphatase family protein [Solirubrobacteraceae bacterium]|jgi:endonuclease/exonuclease/phosphatase family metal-dependent hydrolase
MLVLTWNLKHGRAVPSAGHDLFGEFAAAIAGWEWDVALLQEVPPWWPAPLAARAQATERHVLTSRNLGLSIRRFVASRWPEVAKSNGGGANAILVRGASVLDHRRRRLSLLPERRWVHGVRLDAGLWIWNLHLQGTLDQVLRASAAVLPASRPLPVVLGGDFNLRSPSVPGFNHAGGDGVDHVLVRGLAPDGELEVLERGRLSDHAPLRMALRPAPTPAP